VGLLLVVPHLLAAQGAEGRTLEIPTTIGSAGGDVPGIGDLAQDLGLVVEENKLTLTLEQTIALALDRNLTLVVQRYQRSQAIQGIEQNLGIYDLNIEGTGDASEATSPTTSFLQQTGGADLTFEEQNLNFTLSQLTPMGGGAQFDLRNGRSATSDLTQSPNPGLGVTASFAFRQPLLRDFGRKVTERNLIVARTNTAISREDFQNQVEAIVQQSSDGYWNLVESIEQLTVAEESKGTEVGEKALYGAFSAAREKRDVRRQKEIGQKLLTDYPKGQFIADVLSTLGRQAAEAGRYARYALPLGGKRLRQHDQTDDGG